MNEPIPDELQGDVREVDARELALAEISSLIDGEIETARTLEVVDLLVGNADARVFYRRSRALGGLVEAAVPTPRVEAPAKLWERIAAATEQPSEGRHRPRLALPTRWSTRLGGRRLLLVAAVILVGVIGLWTATSLRRTADQERSQRAEQLAQISIGSRAGDMDDDRFLELVTEILSADRRYRREMAELIGAVENAIPFEGSFEDRRLGDLNERMSGRRSYDETDTGVRDDQVRVRLR